MSTSETETSLIHTEGKRTAPASNEEDATAAVITPTGNNAKKAKTTVSNKDDFRSWSSQVNDSSDKCTVYTIKCTFGDASKPLPSFIKTNKVGFIKDMLEMRGLSTVGTKPVLLQRLQTDLPFVLIEIDGRECMQRLVNCMMYHLKWDNGHLFEMKMPRRGELMDGVDKLWKSIGSYDMGFAIKIGNVSPDPREQEPHLQRRLKQLGVTNETIARIIENPNVMGSVRKLAGAGFNPMMKSPRYGFDEEAADGGWFSLEELALRKGDKIDLMYDLGQSDLFVLEIQEVKESVPVLPEIDPYHQKTRAKLVGKGASKMRKQYDDGGSPY